MKERRKLERFQLRLPAKLEILPEAPQAEKELLELHTSNICSGGAFFRTWNPLAPGTVVMIDLLLEIPNGGFSINGKSLVEMRGRVVRSEHRGMAIAFDRRYKIKLQPKA